MRANPEGVYQAYVKIGHPFINRHSNGLFTIDHVTPPIDQERWGMWITPRPHSGIAEANGYHVTSRFSPILSQTING